MFHLTPLFSLASLSLLTLTAAAPTAATAVSEPVVFSFAKWVDDIVTNPETALSPEAAWQAYLDTSSNATSKVPVTARDSAATSVVGLEKRWDPDVSCNNYDPGPAWVSSSPSLRSVFLPRQKERPEKLTVP